MSGAVHTSRRKAFFAEPIIQMIGLHVMLIILVAAGTLGLEQYVRKVYYEPAEHEVENRRSRSRLAEVIVGTLKDIEVEYRRLADCSSRKSVALHSGNLEASCREIRKALIVLENGGDYTHVRLANFYDKDEFSEFIHHERDADDGLLIYGINIAPKLEELLERIRKTEQIVLEEKIGDGVVRSGELRLVTLQTEALLLRLRESANKVFYDIRESNAATFEEIGAIRKKTQTAVLLINILSSCVVVGVALIISWKIFVILRSQRVTEAQNLKLSTLVEQNPSAIVITDLDGVIEYVNPAFLQLTGYSREESIGEKTSIIKSGMTPDAVYKDLWETIEAGKIWFGRLRNKRKNGTLFDEEVVISPVRDAGGRMINYVSVKLNITDKVELEEEQRRTHLSMKAIVDNLPIGVVLVNRRKEIIEINAEASRIFGFADLQSAEDFFLGRPCRDAFCDADCGKCPILDLHQEGESFVEKTVTLNKKIHILKSVIMINYQGDDVLMEVFLDITERKMHERLLQTETDRANCLAEEARKANQVKSDFLANMSHEIRTPLNSVIGMAQMLARTELDVQQKGYVKRINTSSEMLLQVINDILDFSKIEAGKVEVEEVDFELRSFFDELYSIMEPQLKGKPVELIFEIAPELPVAICSDRLRIGQVLINLLGNAIKFTHEGYVRLSVSCVRIPWSPEERWGIRFEVCDSGIGIHADHLKELFRPFTQSDTSTTRKYGGTGLGLVISKHLTEMLGGSMQVDSTPGKGSCFAFELDLQEAEPPPEKSVVVDDVPNLSRFSVLLVEDNEINQLVAQGLLEPTQVNITLAENGKEAVDLVGENSFDLILMDLQMPVMDGFEAMKIIRGTHPDLPIVALSAAAMADDCARARAAGADAHIGKPIDILELFTVLSDLMS